VLETPGRILVITSNFPDKLDRALVRPGRIDVTIEFRNTNRAFILDMVNKFYSVEYSLEDIPEELEGIFTPAEVMESLCTHFKDPDAALEHMVGKIEAKVASKQGTSLEALAYSKAPMLVFDGLEETIEATATPPIPLPVSLDTPVVETVKEILHNEIVDTQTRPKQQQQQQQQRPPVKDLSKDTYAANKVPVKLNPSFESTWSTADFGDVAFQGGHMPGEFGVRSAIDLNSM